MTDRELLELAAKAAGYSEFCIDEVGEAQARKQNEVWASWNPLTDDGDALRLAALIMLPVAFYHFKTVVEMGNYGRIVEHWVDQGRYLATRRAIVRAAAELGKRMD